MKTVKLITMVLLLAVGITAGPNICAAYDDYSSCLHTGTCTQVHPSTRTKTTPLYGTQPHCQEITAHSTYTMMVPTRTETEFQSFLDWSASHPDRVTVVGCSCGDGVLDAENRLGCDGGWYIDPHGNQLRCPEECEGNNLNGQTCAGLGYYTGTLACASTCQFDISGCHNCGNDTCDSGETRAGCSGDCPDCNYGAANCTNGHCNSGYVADGSGGCTTCGNGACDNGETISSCVGDCPQCNAGASNCTNGYCNSGYVPNGSGGCQTFCGDSILAGSETCDCGDASHALASGCGSKNDVLCPTYGCNYCSSCTAWTGCPYSQLVCHTDGNVHAKDTCGNIETAIYSNCGGLGCASGVCNCGNGTCGSGETVSNCSTDCPQCNYGAANCTNGRCNSGYVANGSGGCQTFCGDSILAGSETCDCGDNICHTGIEDDPLKPTKFCCKDCPSVPGCSCTVINLAYDPSPEVRAANCPWSQSGCHGGWSYTGCNGTIPTRSHCGITDGNAALNAIQACYKLGYKYMVDYKSECLINAGGRSACTCPVRCSGCSTSCRWGNAANACGTPGPGSGPSREEGHLREILCSDSPSCVPPADWVICANPCSGVVRQPTATPETCS